MELGAFDRSVTANSIGPAILIAVGLILVVVGFLRCDIEPAIKFKVPEGLLPVLNQIRNGPCGITRAIMQDEVPGE